MQSKQTLTPAFSLSERERVNHSAPLEQSLDGDSVERDRKCLPLLGGEGRGEGERLPSLNGYGLVVQFDRIEIVFEGFAKLGGQVAANSTRLANFPGIRRLATRVAGLRNGRLIGCAAGHTATGRLAHAHADTGTVFHRHHLDERRRFFRRAALLAAAALGLLVDQINRVGEQFDGFYLSLVRDFVRLGFAEKRGCGLHRAVAGEIRAKFPGHVFTAVIPHNIALAEAPSHSKTILQYAPYSHGAKSYRALAEEVLDIEEE